MDTHLGSVSTFFAPAGRDPQDELDRKYHVVLQTPLLQQTIDAMLDVVLILNERRQIVNVNRVLLDLLQCRLSDILGKRPGELLGCRNAGDGPDGCGTARQCVTCGAIEAIMISQQSGHPESRECRILLESPAGTAFDFRVNATTAKVDTERFTIFVLKDISHQKRLDVMNRMFFHDVINTAGGIRGFAELMRDGFPKNSPHARELEELEELAEHLLEEIESQRDLTYAESGNLTPDFRDLEVGHFLEWMRALYLRHPVADHKRLVVVPSWEGTILTDQRLLGRVVGNMLKNALEASESSGRVTLACQEKGDQVAFRVHNNAVIPDHVQMQIFQRSFSTKGELGRGIGTHSMKLLGERYLQGHVSFASSPSEGTTFILLLPKRPAF